jgi:hypothetical protein
LTLYSSLCSIMFKKRTLKTKKPQVRKRQADDDHDEVDDEDMNIQQAILKTQKKQKLYASLDLSVGDYTKRKIPTTSVTSKKEHVEAAAASQDNDGSLLAQKHQQAMDDFITQKMQGTKVVIADVPTPKVDDDTALYQELAAQAGAVTTVNQKEQEGDVGTGGAMLVGGTGIAEVILPVQTRLESSLRQQQQTTLRKRVPLRGSSAAPASEAEQQSSNLLPTKFAATSSARGNAVDSAPSGTTSNTGNRSNPMPATETASTTTTQEDDGRTGFAALRGHTTTTTKPSSSSTTATTTWNKNNTNNNNSQKPHRSNDDRVFSKFVSRERDQRHNK